MLIAQPLGPEFLPFPPPMEPEGRLVDGCLWIEDVVGTGAPTSLWPKMGLCPLCACHHPLGHTPGFPDGEVAGKFFIFKEMKTGNYWGRLEGKWENGLDFVCVCCFFLFLVVVCNFP